MKFIFKNIHLVGGFSIGWAIATGNVPLGLVGAVLVATSFYHIYSK